MMEEIVLEKSERVNDSYENMLTENIQMPNANTKTVISF